MKMPERVDGSEPADLDRGEADQAMAVAAPAAEADIAAAFLVEVMGEDVAAAFFARFGAMMAEACRKAEALAHRHRAEDEPETEIPASQVRRAGPLAEARSPEDGSQIRALAAAIERGEAPAPIVVMLQPKACCSARPYDLISGWDEFRAFVDVLGRTLVPVRIAPPVPPDTLTLFDGPDDSNGR